jgi:RecA-family ATPase
VKNLEKMAQQYDVAIILVAHPKKSNADFDNDTVSGSSDITNAVSFVFNYERAKQGEDYDSRLMVTKNRLNGKLLLGENAIKLHYSEKSKRILSNEFENIDYGCFRVEEDFSDLDEMPF